MSLKTKSPTTRRGSAFISNECTFFATTIDNNTDMNPHRSLLYQDTSSIMSVASPAIRRESSRYASRLRDSLSLNPGLVFNSTSDQSITMTSMSMSVNDSSTLMGGSGLSLSRSGHNMTAVAEEEEELTVAVTDQEACSTLYQQFQDGLIKYQVNEDIFDLVKEYEGICSDHLQVLDQLKRQRTKQGIRFDDTVVSAEVLRMLHLERNSWRLIGSLYFDRIKSSAEDQQQDMAVDESRVLSDRQVIDQLYERNSRIRQMQLIADWLELNFQDDMMRMENEENIRFYSEGPHYWENTLHQADAKKIKLWDKQSVHMDPDALIRNPGEIHELDKEDESRIMRFVFRYIRSGQLPAGKELAQKLGFHWLAAGLEGWMLHHDANLCPEENDIESGGRIIPDGNARRDLWKYVCWSAATHSKGMSLYEKAIFGSLSGNVAATLPACPKWPDKLWAFVKASIDVQIEQELRNNQSEKPATGRTGAGALLTAVRASVDLPAEFWSSAKSMEEIFREVEGLLSDYEWDVDEKIHFLVQKFVITEDVDSALETMAVFIRTTDDEDSGVRLRPHIVRFFAHVALFYKTIGLIEDGTRQAHYNTVIDSYVNYLTEKRHIGLVASYVAKLPQDLQVYSYSKLLLKIKDKAERKKCLTLAKDAGLDVEEATKSVVEAMRQTNQTSVMETTSLIDASLTGAASAKTEEADAQLINSLEWLSIGTVQYIEILKQGNALMRNFVLSGKMEAAKEVFRRSPTDLIEGVQRSWKRKTGAQDLSLELKNLTKEFVSFSAFFCVLESFNDWVHYFHNGKPRQPEKPKSTKFTDKVAFDHLSRVYQSELEQWRTVLSKQAKMTSNKIHQVLLFEGGWMRDGESKTTSRRQQDVSRTQELASLRKRFIPEVTSILHTVLHLSGRYRECLQIADTIACEDNQLHVEFTSEQIGELLQKLRESSVASLTDGNDAFGYPDESRPQASEPTLDYSPITIL